MSTPNDTKRDEVLAQLADDARKGVPFGHFLLFYESIERVTDRRLNLNRNNASLASLIAAGMGVLAAWAYDKADARPIAFALLFFLGLLAALFCRWWWRQIEDYKALNGSKFDVLAQMAKNIIEPAKCGFDPFFWEWKISEANKSLIGWNGRMALGSSWSELIVPKAFLTFFVFVAVLAAVMFALELGWIGSLWGDG